MLVKLIKHEFLQTGRIFLWLLAIGLVGGGIGALFTLNQNIGAGQFIAAFVWNFLLVIGASVMQILGLVMLMVSTNRSLFSERGYLTFALPVTSTQLLFSKFTSNVAFMLLNIGQAGLLSYVAGRNIGRLVGNLGENLVEQFGMEGMQEQFTMNEMVEAPSAGEFIVFGSYLLAIILFFLILAMMVVLFALTISHVRPFQLMPGLWIPVFLAASITVSALVTRFISGLVRMNVTLNFGGMLADGNSVNLNVSSGIVMLGLAAGFFFATNWLLRKKISLK